MKTLLHRYLLFLAAATFLLIIAGGLVTSTGSGLSVPDWPLSYGSLFPPMIGGIRFEHSHRVIAGAIGLLTLLLTILICKLEKRSWVKMLGFVALVMVVAQAVLGGLTVIYLLPTWISVSHACLGQTFFCLIAVLAYVTSRQWIEAKPVAITGHMLRLFLVTALFVYLQLVAGAVVRHTGGKAVSTHIVLASLIVMHVFFILFRCVRHAELRNTLVGHSALLSALVMTQVSLGMGAFYTKLIMPKAMSPRVIEVLTATAHQAMGALILATCILLALRAFRYRMAGPSNGSAA